jgi:hypothetical protein
VADNGGIYNLKITMRKLIIVIAITLIAAATANAQFYKGFGVKVGTSIANMDYTYPTTAIVDNEYRTRNNKIGLTIGIFKEINLIENLKAQIGINYARKGNKLELKELDEFGIATGSTYFDYYSYNFITAELYGKYSFLKSKVNPYVLAGLRMDFYVSQEVTIKDPLFIGGEYTYMDPVTNNKILGASLGAGVEYQASKLFSLFLEGTYNPDFTYITNESTYNEVKIRGRSFDIRTGIKF